MNNEDIDIVENAPIFTFSNLDKNICEQKIDLKLDEIEILIYT